MMKKLEASVEIIDLDDQASFRPVLSSEFSEPCGERGILPRDQFELAAQSLNRSIVAEIHRISNRDMSAKVLRGAGIRDPSPVLIGRIGWLSSPNIPAQKLRNPSV